MPPSSGLGSKPGKKPAEAGGKLAPPKCQGLSKLYVVTTLKTVLFIVIATRTSDPTTNMLHNLKCQKNAQQSRQELRGESNKPAGYSERTVKKRE
jgi:hypothetical protein